MRTMVERERNILRRERSTAVRPPERVSDFPTIGLLRESTRPYVSFDHLRPVRKRRQKLFISFRNVVESGCPAENTTVKLNIEHCSKARLEWSEATDPDLRSSFSRESHNLARVVWTDEKEPCLSC
ncbi:hypothetical protein PHSY_007174 [Pseudozyma hubeiensis SY62]|uniref:Uncharacterized protein n=1 Tax=Pseudozyma hubeiensis (strain SY62) TaxID=1305764 RepID=R9PE90_PSEHS|nr:hypothetical protein PHSY_007174 [Pseudozyma hubeiensis SY62]GAC99572.1 hypothetical protein PHSY_007174 [Pseudozyma hubeiensis SY62]